MKNKKKIVFLILLFGCAVVVFFHISMAIFEYLGKGTTNNVIETGKVVFSYDSLTNGINITDAVPTPDLSGKKHLGRDEYFDFKVTASTTNTDLVYEITADRDDDSDLPENYVKIYLTEKTGSTEKETPITGKDVVPTYSELKPTTNSLLTGKSLYFGEVKAGEVAYGKEFRLRMWVKDIPEAIYNTELLNNKKFTIKVNVAAVGSN